MDHNLSTSVAVSMACSSPGLGTSWALPLLVMQGGVLVLELLFGSRDLRLLFGWLVLGILSILVGRRRVRAVTRPLQLLTKLTQRVATGDYAVDVPRAKIREIDLVAVALQDLVASLRQAQAENERRTRELTAANEDYAAAVALLEETHEQLVHSGRMAAVGTAVAGVSHELNNPIGVILSAAQGLLKRLPESDPHRGPLLVIERNALRCGRLVRSLLDFSHPRQSERKPVAVNELIDSALRMFSGTPGERKVTIERLPLSHDLPAVIAAADEIESVLFNLLKNAIDATAIGGYVAVGARKESREGQQGVQFLVEDHGSGISPEIHSRIFEPFFTTKEPGRGTGLGLSLSRQIVESHGGYFAVESAVGQGTTMRFWLPAELPEKDV